MKKKPTFIPGHREKHSGKAVIVEQFILVPEGGGRKETCEATFLRRKEAEHRKQTYISYEIYSKLSRILPLLGEGMTVSAVLDNVLTHHPETYRDEMEELFRDKAERMLFCTGQWYTAPCHAMTHGMH